MHTALLQRTLRLQEGGSANSSTKYATPFHFMYKAELVNADMNKRTQGNMKILLVVNMVRLQLPSAAGAKFCKSGS